MTNPQQAADNWANGMANAGTKMRAGIEAVTTNPMETAAGRVDAYVAGVQRAASNGKYQAGLRRVTLQDWKRAMIDKGLGRIAGGAQAGKPKMQQFLAEFLPYVETVKASLPPRGSLDQNIQRMIQQVQGNAAFRRRS